MRSRTSPRPRSWPFLAHDYSIEDLEAIKKDQDFKTDADAIFDNIMGDVWVAERAAKAVVSEARRIKREIKDPAAALAKALDAAKREAMENSGDKDDAKRDARESGEAWGDIKDEWEEQWIEDNWTAEEEAAFLIEFWAHWLKDHGSPFPEAVRCPSIERSTSLLRQEPIASTKWRTPSSRSSRKGRCSNDTDTDTRSSANRGGSR